MTILFTNTSVWKVFKICMGGIFRDNESYGLTRYHKRSRRSDLRGANDGVERDRSNAGHPDGEESKHRGELNLFIRIH